MVKTMERNITENEVVLLCQYGVLNPNKLVNSLNEMIQPAESTAEKAEKQTAHILKIDEVCKLLNVSPSTVRRLSDAGKLKKLRISNKRIGWNAESIEQYIENLKVS